MAEESATGGRIPVRNRGDTLTGSVHEPDVDVVVDLTLAQAVSGATVATEITRHSPCPDCQGVGLRRASGACAACDGAGVTVRHSGGIAIRRACPSCEGRGEAAPERCGVCAGVGLTSRPSQVTIRIPAGVFDGTRLRVPKVGAVKRGPDGLAEGDLYVLVKIAADPVFDRRGADLWIRLAITLTEAAVSATVSVPTKATPWLSGYHRAPDTGGRCECGTGAYLPVALAATWY